MQGLQIYNMKHLKGWYFSLIKIKPTPCPQEIANTNEWVQNERF